MFVKRYLHFYALSVLIIALQLAIYGFGSILSNSCVNLHNIVYLVRCVTDGLLLSLPVLILSPRYKRLGWILIWLMTLFVIVQMMYFQTYEDVMPFTSFIMFENLDLVLFRSAIASFNLSQAVVLAFPIIGMVIYYKFISKKLKQEPNNWRLNRVIISLVMLFSVFLVLFQSWNNYRQEKGRTTNSYWGRYTETRGSVCYFNLNGFVPYLIYNICATLNEDSQISENDKREIKRFLKKNNCAGDNESQLFSNNNKNLILIIVESLNSWVIGQKIDGREVCPNLNSYCKLDGSLVALRMQPQVKDGRSSDGHFMYNVGLLPLRDGVTTVLRGDVKYPSLAKALKGYKAVDINCDSQNMWNQMEFGKNIGFKKIYHCTKIQEMLKQEDSWIKDAEMFKASEKILSKLEQPFYAQLVTIAMHQPYTTLIVPPTWISKSNEYTQEVRNYLETVHYFDNSLGKFIESIKKMGIYDNSVIAILSDHNELDLNKVEGRAEKQAGDSDCAFVVLNAGTTIEYKDIIGQIDVYPTLIDVMGANDYSWKGVGNSILRTPKVASAAINSEKIVGNVNLSLVKKQRKAWKICDKIIRYRYFNIN